VREGQALVRSSTEAALFVADEDHAMLRRVALVNELSHPDPLKLPLGDHDTPPLHELTATEVDVPMPGRPAQVFSLGDRILVTVREPGLLVVLSAGEAPKELGRVELPPDAWGLAVSADGKSAFVTSAWSHRVSRVDLDAMKMVWSVDVAREPRGITVTEDGKKLYVSHLVGSELTKIEIGTGEPKVTRVSLPADPLRTMVGDKSITASLGYALALSPDGLRLFTSRQALGTFWNWQGNPTVDALIVASDEPLAPARGGKPFGQLSRDQLERDRGDWDSHGAFASSTAPHWVQPRAMVYRKKTHQLLVASEGTSELVELDALSLSPGVLENRLYRLGGLRPEVANAMRITPHCGAPSAVALSEDEDVAWVYCRTTDEITAVRLTPTGERAYRSEVEYVEAAAYHTKLSAYGPFAYAKLATPPTSESLALGRRLFFEGMEPTVSGNMGCAGCHPDGRDDGHVWRERKETRDRFGHFSAGPTLALSMVKDEPNAPYGYARQTPMLAGRVSARGPYGWHGESATLVDRIRDGFQLHRPSDLLTDGQMLRVRAEPIAEYLRDGLVAPKGRTTELTPEELSGKKIFESDKTACVTCHVPSTEFTNRSVVPLASKAPPLFDDDPNKGYKVPSLLFVGSTPPYYHDASAPTLELLIEKNGDHMGKTSHLDAAERAELVAYLKTL
jgi:hypothetical protein